MQRTKSLFIQNFDKMAAIIGIISSILIIIYIIEKFNKLNYILLGLLIFFSCVAWVIMREKASLNTDLSCSPTQFLILKIVLLFILFFSFISIIAREECYVRPFTYFISVSLFAEFLFLTILLSFGNGKSFLLLLIILLGLISCWSQLVIFPTVIGIDPWYHQWFTLRILNECHIPNWENYSMLPAFHLIIAFTSLITGLDYRFSSGLSIGFAQIICNVLFIFLISKLFFYNYKIGLLASFFTVIANQHIFMSYWIIPNGFASIFILIGLYIIFKIRVISPFPAIVLLMLIFAALIITHTIAAATFSLLLFMITLSCYIYSIYAKQSTYTKTKEDKTFLNGIYVQQKIKSTLTLSIIFFVTMLFWWSYASGTLPALGRLFKWGSSIDKPFTIPLDSVSVPIFEPIFNQIGMFIFFSLALIGIFYMLSPKSSHLVFTYAVQGFTVLSLGFFPFMSGQSLIEQRWWFMAEILLAIPSAVAVIILYNISVRRITVPVLITFIYILTFLMVMSIPANIDNGTITPNSQMRYALTSSEIQAANTVSKFCSLELKTDSYYAGRINYLGGKLSSISDNILRPDWKFSRTGIFLVRKEIINRPSRFSGQIYNLGHYIDLLLSNIYCNKIYDCYEVTGYL